MNHLNYCRQLALHCRATLELELPSLDSDRRAILENVIDLHASSTKFLLPKGGRLFDDMHFRALDEYESLRLPYPCIALEYQAISGPGTPIYSDDQGPVFQDDSALIAPKRVVFAREFGDVIIVTAAFWAKEDHSWRVLPECALPKTGYLDRTKELRGRTSIAAIFNCQMDMRTDYSDELGALLCFLNVLQCSNVHVERNEPKKAGKKIKAALPFDTYHILTIGSPGNAAGGYATGGHRSPREHLRRGHIRRLADGRRIWVNATVVAAGRAAGVVTKDYAVRCAT